MLASTQLLKAAKEAVAAYRDLHQRLVFIATDKAADRELRALLQEHEPPVEPVMRDLGIGSMSPLGLDNFPRLEEHSSSLELQGPCHPHHGKDQCGLSFKGHQSLSQHLVVGLGGHDLLSQLL